MIIPSDRFISPQFSESSSRTIMGASYGKLPLPLISSVSWFFYCFGLIQHRSHLHLLFLFLVLHFSLRYSQLLGIFTMRQQYIHKTLQSTRLFGFILRLLCHVKNASRLQVFPLIEFCYLSTLIIMNSETESTDHLLTDNEHINEVMKGLRNNDPK
jgi:hypothetical protein